MNWARLQQQLAKEIKKSPAKAAALAALTLVALYAWAPLLFRGADKVSPPRDIVSNQPEPAEQGASGQAAVKLGLPLPWEALATWIDEDPSMKSATLASSGSQPFGKQQPADELAMQTQTDPAEVASSDAIDPKSLGVKVSSTMVSKHRRVAVINGRPYAEGHEFQLGGDATFTLVQVGTRHVVLEGAGRRFDLPVTASGAAEAAP